MLFSDSPNKFAFFPKFMLLSFYIYLGGGGGDKGVNFCLSTLSNQYIYQNEVCCHRPYAKMI